MKVRVEGYIVHKERGREDLEPHDWDLDYLKAWLTDVLNPVNECVEIMLDITPIKEK